MCLPREDIQTGEKSHILAPFSLMYLFCILLSFCFFTDFFVQDAVGQSATVHIN